MVKAILFDIDGVIIRHESFFESALSADEYRDPHRVITEFFQSDDCKRADRGQVHPFDAVRPYLDRIGWTGTSQEYFDRQHDYERQFIDHGLLSRIKALNGNRAKCYIASNQNVYRKEFLREALSLSANFSAVFFSSEIGAMKPEDCYWDAVIGRLASDIPGIAPGETLFLDDLEENVASAERRGIQTLWVRSAADIERVAGYL
jgi:putative hydrolase of the HAD superfamily